MSHLNELLVNAASMGADVTSASVNVQYAALGAIQCVFTGTPVGTMKLQASCDVVQPTPNSVPAATNWTDVADTSVDVSAAGTILYNLIYIGYDQVRVVYTRTSGSGTLNVRAVAKG